MLEGYGEWGPLFTVSQIATGPATLEFSVENFKKLKMSLQYDPAVPELAYTQRTWHYITQALS